jgi:Rad3-related DNA helicase
MNDEGILNKIEELVQEEHKLLELDENDPRDRHERLHSVEVELDRCWDLLRQRRARREFDENPDDASLRDASTVERYWQ